MYIISIMIFTFSIRDFGHPQFVKYHFGHPVIKIMAKSLRGRGGFYTYIHTYIHTYIKKKAVSVSFFPLMPCQSLEPIDSVESHPFSIETCSLTNYRLWNNSKEIRKYNITS